MKEDAGKDIAMLKSLKDYIEYKSKLRDELGIDKRSEETGLIPGDMGFPYGEINRLRFKKLDALIKVCQLAFDLIL